MDNLVKKYVWLVDLVVIGTCAGFAGRAGARVLEAAFLVEGEINKPTRRHAPAPVQKQHGKDADPIVKRNIFCSACPPPPPARVETRAVSNEPSLAIDPGTGDI